MLTSNNESISNFYEMLIYFVDLFLNQIYLIYLINLVHLIHGLFKGEYKSFSIKLLRILWVNLLVYLNTVLSLFLVEKIEQVKYSNYNAQLAQLSKVVFNSLHMHWMGVSYYLIYDTWYRSKYKAIYSIVKYSLINN